MAQPTVEELGVELGLDSEDLGYWSQGGNVPLGEYTWYGPAIAAVPAGGSRTDNQKPSLTTVFRLSKLNKDGTDVGSILEELSIGGEFQYGQERWTIESINSYTEHVDVNVSGHNGPDENFLAAAISVNADANIRVLKSAANLMTIGFESTEIEKPIIVEVPWTWQEVLDTLISNGVDSLETPWNPLELLARATSEQNKQAFGAVADTMEWKNEISTAAKEDLIALTERTEEGSETVLGPSRWTELWGITTIQTSVVIDARIYAINNYS